MKIIGIDPEITETKMALLVNGIVDGVVKIRPPSSMLYEPKDQLSVILTDINRELLNNTQHICIIKRPDTKEIVDGIKDLCNNYKIPLTLVNQIETKESLGMRKHHAPIHIYQQIIKEFNDASNILTGCYAVGAAVHIFNTLK